MLEAARAYFFRGFALSFTKEVLHVRRTPANAFLFPCHSAAADGCAWFPGIDTNIRQINTVVYNADDRAKVANFSIA